MTHPAQSARAGIDTFLTALAPMIWGTTYIVTTEALPPDRPFTAALLRCLPAGPVLVALTRRLPHRSAWVRLVILSILNIGAFQALLFVAAYRLPGGLAAVIGAFQPLMIMALAWSVEGRTPGRVPALAAILGIGGMAALILTPGASWDALGILAAFAGSASMALGTYLTRRWQTGLPVASLTGWQLLIGGLVLLPLAGLADAPLPALSPLNQLGYAYLTLCGALLAYGLWFRGIARLSPVAVSSLGLLSPLTAVTLGWVLLGESLSLLALAGFVTVLASVFAIQLSTAPARPVRRPVPLPAQRPALEPAE